MLVITKKNPDLVWAVRHAIQSFVKVFECAPNTVRLSPDIYEQINTDYAIVDPLVDALMSVYKSENLSPGTMYVEYRTSLGPIGSLFVYLLPPEADHDRPE